MANYGDPEAHRCILEEVCATPDASHLIGCLKAAVMGSQGSDVGVQKLRCFHGASEELGVHLEVMLALLSLTVLASKADPGFRAEQKRVRELLGQRRAVLTQQAEHIKSLAGGGVDRSRTGPSSSHVAMFSSDVNSGLPPAVMEGTSLADKEAKVSLVQQWEQSMDILNYCEAYANYLGGFTALWYELFGANYYYAAKAKDLCDENDDGVDGDGSGAWPNEARVPAPPSLPPSSFASRQQPPQQHQKVRHREQPSQCPQVPPHLYAVRWGEILTPQRRAWFHGLHNLVKELLVRILHRELPLELYVLFVQYASLSLRMYLLETLAKVFEWTSHCVDVICYVHVMRQSYSIQCEMLQLQRIWSSFGLYDSRFFVDCGEFNKMYAESQGGFSDQRKVWPIKPPTAPRTTAAQIGTATAAAVSPTAAAKVRHAHNNSSATNDTTASPPPYTLATTFASAMTPSTDSTAVVSARVCRIFPVCDAAVNISSDAADAGHSTTSRTPQDEATSSASDYVEAAGTAGATKHAVHLPLFYTCCCFTWILQRTFWSMYGRCALLFEGCLGIEAVPRVSSVDCSGELDRGDAPMLFTTTQLSTWRRVGVTDGSGVADSTTSTASPMMRMNGGAAARDRTLTSSSISVTTTGNNLTNHQSRLEAGSCTDDDDAHAKVEAVANRSRPPHAPRLCLHPTPPSQPFSDYTIEAAHLPVPTDVVSDGARAEAVEANLTREAATPEPNDERRGEEGAAFSWGSVLGRFVQRGQSRQDRFVEAARGHGNAGHGPHKGQRAQISFSPSPAALPGGPLPASAPSVGALERRNGSPPLRSSGAPFHFQYPHWESEVQMYDDPPVMFTHGSPDTRVANTFFFEEFHFLQKTGCYVLSHALRNLTCYPRYPATLLVLTDNTTRPGRVSWLDHKFSILSSSTDDGQERRGLTPWVLNAVIPHTRLSSIPSVRASQEEALLEHIVFQVAGATSARVHFCTPNSIFFILNSGSEMDGGRLYFALHLHVDLSTRKESDPSIDAVMKEESQWAFRALGELHVSWAMSCTCNEALRVAFQIRSEETKS
ncbi:hypothetical protein JKF63_01413 [Porcisia hertigi]|uniref:Uncharacterized protein n=1 Tax=Porcisia hertigi TaxID=2761500 RepID=A0A836L9Y5_9TRYP|nr:hypothetical protein JKF63_01413 [Porcisia hertigi]